MIGGGYSPSAGIMFASKAHKKVVAGGRIILLSKEDTTCQQCFQSTD